MTCPHMGLATIAPVQPRVLVTGQPVATALSKIVVAGCVFTVPGPKPQPCVLVQWIGVAARVLVMGQPALVQTGPGPGQGVALSPEQIPQGPPIVQFVQPRVFGM